MLLAVEGLGKRYANRWIFRGISFGLEQGQRLVILGPNGSGKSTLLKTIAGLIPATEGQVRVPEQDGRRSLGASAIDLAVYPHLTVEEHLDLGGKLRGCDPRTDELLEFVNLAYARDRFGGQLSTGMRGRLKLALAIQAQPKVLLLDEPGAGLDEGGRAVVHKIIEEQTTRGCVVLATNEQAERRFATHELELAS